MSPIISFITLTHDICYSRICDILHVCCSDERDLDLDDDRGHDRDRRRSRRRDDDVDDPQDDPDRRRRDERQRRKEERRSQREAQQAEFEHKQAADGKSPKLAPLPVNPDEELTQRQSHLMRLDQSETSKPYRLYGQFPYSHEIWLVIWGIIKIWIYILFFFAAIFIMGTNYQKPDCIPSTNSDFCLINADPTTSTHLCLDTSIPVCNYACTLPSSLSYDDGTGNARTIPPFPSSRLSGPSPLPNVLTGYGCYVSNIPSPVTFSSSYKFLPFNLTSLKGAEIICLGPTPEYRNIFDRFNSITTRTLMLDFKSMCDDTTNCPNSNLTLMTRAYTPIVVVLMFLIVIETVICVGLCVFASNHPSEFDSITRAEKWLLCATRSGFFLIQFFWFCVFISYLYIIFNYAQYHTPCDTALVIGNIPLVLFPHTRTYIIAFGVMFVVITFVGTTIREHLPMRGEMYVPSHDDELIFPCGLDCKTCRDRPQPKCCPDCFANWEECGYGTFLARRCAWTCDRIFSVTVGPLGALLERCWKKRHFLGP